MARSSVPSPVMEEKWWERWRPWKCGDLVPESSGLRHPPQTRHPRQRTIYSAIPDPTVTKDLFDEAPWMRS